jgi:hypothetical protein
MSKDFNYHQRAATTEYRDNWDRIYGNKPNKPDRVSAPLNDLDIRGAIVPITQQFCNKGYNGAPKTKGGQMNYLEAAAQLFGEDAATKQAALLNQLSVKLWLACKADPPTVEGQLCDIAHNLDKNGKHFVTTLVDFIRLQEEK